MVTSQICGSEEHENSVAEHKAEEAKLDVERENLLAKLEHLKGQVLKLRKR
jgi:hypothetical protein